MPKYPQSVISDIIRKHFPEAVGPVICVGGITGCRTVICPVLPDGWTEDDVDAWAEQHLDDPIDPVEVTISTEGEDGLMHFKSRFKI